MILNKFSRISHPVRLKALSIQLMALSLFSCNKTANINANKAYVSFTHYAYNVDSLKLNIDGQAIFSWISFDSATGYPYGTVTSQVSNTTILGKNDTFLTGFSSFRQGANYSIYAYDTLDANTLAPESKSLIILQDSPPLNTDSTLSIRYMNFVPSSLIGLLLLNTRHGTTPIANDTVVISPAYFVGLENNPAAYVFRPILGGTYNIFAFIDSTTARPDSSNIRYMGNFNFSVTTNYNFNLVGFYNLTTGPYQLQFKKVALN
jgi:hypothetical protein